MVSIPRSSLPYSHAELIQKLLDDPEAEPLHKTVLNGLCGAPIAGLDLQEESGDETDATTDGEQPNDGADDEYSDEESEEAFPAAAPPHFQANNQTNARNDDDDMPSLQSESESDDDRPAPRHAHANPPDDDDYNSMPELEEDEESEDEHVPQGAARQQRNAQGANARADQRQQQEREKQARKLKEEAEQRKLEKKKQAEKRRQEELRRQYDRKEPQYAKAERPEELFQQQQEERERLRREKGMVEEAADAPELQVVAACCADAVRATVTAEPERHQVPPSKIESIQCTKEGAAGTITQDQHRMVFECEHGCKLYSHYPACASKMCLQLHLPKLKRRWGMLVSLKTSQKVAADALQCLNAGCTGRLLRTTVERAKGKGGDEVFFQAQWHLDALAAEEAKRKQEAEDAKRAAEERKAAEHARRAAEADDGSVAAQGKNRNQEKKVDREARRNQARNLKTNAPLAAVVAAAVVPADHALNIDGKRVRGRVDVTSVAANLLGGGAGARRRAAAQPEDAKVDEEHVQKVMALDADQMKQVERKHGDDPFGADAAEAPAAAKAKTKEEKERDKRERQAARKKNKRGRAVDMNFGEAEPESPPAARAPEMQPPMNAVQDRVANLVQNDQTFGMHNVAPPPVAPPAASARSNRPVGRAAGPAATEFPSLGQAGLAQENRPFGVAHVLELMHVNHFLEAPNQTADTPFLLLDNLDVASLSLGRGSIQAKLRDHIPAKVERAVVFAEEGCAAIEVAEHSARDVMNRVHNTHIGNKPVIMSQLIEFPDDSLMTRVITEQREGHNPGTELRAIIAQRRNDRGQAQLPSEEDLKAVARILAEEQAAMLADERAAARAARAAEEQATRAAMMAPLARGAPGRGAPAAPPRGPPAMVPPGGGMRGAAPAAAPPLRPPGLQVSAPRPAGLTVTAPPPQEAARLATPASMSVASGAPSADGSPPAMTFEQGDQLLRKNEHNQFKGVHSFFFRFMSVYIVPVTVSNFSELSTFLLPLNYFPDIQENRREGAALILFDKGTETLYGLKELLVMRMGDQEKVQCSPLLPRTHELFPIVGTSPDARRLLQTELAALATQRTTQVLTGPKAWHTLQLWASMYGPAALTAGLAESSA